MLNNQEKFIGILNRINEISISCDIDNKDIRTKYWDVHKSGYNKEIMYFYLNRNGFVDIDIKTVDKWHLVVVGFKNNV